MMKNDLRVGLLFLAISLFPPFYPILAFPLALSLFVGGYTPLYLLTGVIAISLLPYTFLQTYLASIFLAVLFGGIIFLSIKKQIKPSKIIHLVSFFLFVIITGSIILIHSTGLLDSISVLIEPIIENNQAFFEKIAEIYPILNDPKTRLDIIIKCLPIIIYLQLFISLWLSFLMVLNFKKKYGLKYNYNAKHLVPSKNNKLLIFPLIISITLIAYKYIALGGLLLTYISSIYFLIGLDLLLEFTKTKLRMPSFMRVLFIFAFVCWAWYIVGLLGILESFLNIKQRIQKNKEIVHESHPN